MRDNFERRMKRYRKTLNIMFVFNIVFIAVILFSTVYIGYKAYDVLSRPETPEEMGKVIGEVLKGIEKGKSQ